MFGRAGRDGEASTAVLLYRKGSDKNKTVAPDIRAFLAGKACLRKKICSALDFPFSAADQGEQHCCSRCNDVADPYGFFEFPTMRKARKAKSTSMNDSKMQVQYFMSYCAHAMQNFKLAFSLRMVIYIPPS